MFVFKRVSLALAALIAMAAVGTAAADVLPPLKATLTAPDGTASDSFGNAVSLSGDTLVVGNADHVVGGATSAGAVYVFVRNPSGGWDLQQELVAPDAALNDVFGRMVSIDGDTLVVGSPQHYTGVGVGQGAAYVYVRAAGQWTLQQEVPLPGGLPDGVTPNLALSGDTFVATNSNAPGPGVAYVYTRTAAVWSQAAIITPPATAGQAKFGLATALRGSTLAITAQPQPTPGFTMGALYIYTLSGGGPTLQTAFDGANAKQFAFFGSVALSGDTILVGDASNNIGWIYQRTGPNWVAGRPVAGTDAQGRPGNFGQSVALSDRFAVIGAPFAGASGEGEAYVYPPNGSSGTAVTLSQPVSNNEFGAAVTTSGPLIAIAAPFKSMVSGGARGVVYVYEAGPLLSQTYVSGTAFDFDPGADCASPRTACSTFSNALAATSSGGTISCLDSGDFGDIGDIDPVTITKSITIDCSGASGGVTAFGISGVIVDAASTDSVILKGLDISGSGPGANSIDGVRMIGAGNLTIMDSLIHGFRGAGSNGVNLIGASGAHVLVENTVIRANTNGVNVAPATGANAAIIDRSTLENNVANNVIVAANGTAVLSASTIAGAPTALRNTGGSIVSYGNNFIRNAGTPTQTLPRH